METGLRHRVPQEIWTAVAIFAKFSRDMREGGGGILYGLCIVQRGMQISKEFGAEENDGSMFKALTATTEDQGSIPRTLEY